MILGHGELVLDHRQIEHHPQWAPLRFELRSSRSCDGRSSTKRALRGGRPPDRSVLGFVCAFGEHGGSGLEDDLVEIVSGDSVACWSNDRIAGGAGMINFSTGKVWKVGVTMVIMQAIEKDEADAWAGD